MGLMDKVKAQAGVLAQKTQETANAAQAKIDSAQASRKADGMLRHLGLAYLAERTGRATPETAANIDKLLAELAQHESQHNVNLVQQATQAQQMQTGPGEYISSSPTAMDPNVSAAPTSFPQAEPAQSGGFPGAAPTSFPQSGGATGFPEAAPATSFPGAAPAGFGEAAPATGFPEAAPATSFPQSGGATGFPEAAPATGFPEAAPATGFPEAAPATSFPGAAPTGFGEPIDESTPEQTGFPPAGGV